ncbi:MAG: DnaJ (Hsp40), subfamily C, member 11 [Paramarteilia canceri]
MKAIYIKTVKEESIQGGLVIQKAIFGPVDVRDGKILNIEQSVDVTIPLQLIVSNHRLTIGSFNAMLLIEGIYDPAPETVKKIMIRYIFQEKIHSVILNDKEPIELPDASHLS